MPGIRNSQSGLLWRTLQTAFGVTERILYVDGWTKELDYRLIKEVWAWDANRIAVRFAYEWQNVRGQWFRSYGNENWEFDLAGLMRMRHASINDLKITEGERLFHWPKGRRPDEHPGLTELGL